MGKLIVSGAVFLSASVPDPKRAPDFAKTADAVAISAAVSALVYVTLGRRLLVWGGHPGITPMIAVVASEMSVDYGDWVKLYQSRYFEDEFPEDNKRFNNAIYTDVSGDRPSSLLHRRERMFAEHKFEAAVFIGGMQGIFDEYHMLEKLLPESALIALGSPGGAARERHSQLFDGEDLDQNLEYVSLFHKRLNISVKEMRYRNRASQPSDIPSRMWKPG
jgi:hypothetical protein